ncbi:MAG: hypothetical protein C4539_09560 [Ignavibacteriales bacterium]|nr:MAG: hypothetical protein C4539_09560 [Ignavibacteriales bacterium]
MLSKIKDDLKGKVSGVTEYIGDLKEEGKEKSISYINGLSEILPIVAKTGYKLKGVDIEMSLPPGINLQFEKFENITKEEIDAIMEANKDKDLLQTIVKTLVMADEFHNKLKMGDLVFTTISVNLSIPPKVSLNFAKN